MTCKDQLVIFGNTSEAICSSVASKLVKCHCRYKRRVTLAPSHHPLLPWRKNGQKIVLSAGLDNNGTLVSLLVPKVLNIPR